MDIEMTQNIIKEFAEKYNFIQQIDIEMVEKLTDFNEYIKSCNKMHGKKYVIIYEWQNKIEIQIGTIFINVDKDEEGDQEFYIIDKNRLFSINVMDFSDKDTLMESMFVKFQTSKIWFN